MGPVTEPVTVRPSELIVPGYREGMTECEFGSLAHTGCARGSTGYSQEIISPRSYA